MRFLIALVMFLAVANAGLLFDRKVAPLGWKQGGRAPSDKIVRFTVALKQRNLDDLEETFWQVSTPGSPKYREFMTIKQILEIVAPEQAVHDSVVKYFQSAGFVKVRTMSDALDVKASVAVAEKLFNTKFYTFFKDGKQIVRAFGQMSLPDEVHQYVAFVEGISTFPIPKYAPKISAPQDAANTIVPQTASVLYKIPAQTTNGHPETSVGVIEFQGQCYAPSDLTTFAQQVNINSQTVSAAHTVGPNDPTSPQIEASLDIEMVATVNTAAQPWFWLEDGQGWLYQFGTHFFSTSSVPQVVSVSYGWSEADQCTIDPTECQALGVDSHGYVARVNAEFQKIALRGVSILVASGDSGANGRTDPDCTTPQLLPDYPAACPYVTSVGATQLNNAQTGIPNSGSIPACNGQGYACAASGQEVAVSFDVASFASGGGFSNVAPRPSYQDAAVAGYMKSGVQLPPASYFNQTGRGYPDLAALGNAILIYQGGLQQVGGTSASSPIWAAVISILNQAAIKKSGKPLGFLNPLIYKIGAECPTCFQDITVGDNICTEDGCSSGCQGYYAAKGWDPVTGFGSPNTPALINYINAHL